LLGYLTSSNLLMREIVSANCATSSPR
jgi:hypothetical protein